MISLNFEIGVVDRHRSQNLNSSNSNKYSGEQKCTLENPGSNN